MDRHLQPFLQAWRAGALAHMTAGERQSRCNPGTLSPSQQPLCSIASLKNTSQYCLKAYLKVFASTVSNLPLFFICHTFILSPGTCLRGGGNDIKGQMF